ncbi:GNAT family N-acetyltransferase [Yinghuangia seranimata]|uniref:GNAT family N-acetyltransferase n=1 Tax=Yinghuangia seranimata TaxID=408067 RepID=UPI003CCFC06B
MNRITPGDVGRRVSVRRLLGPPGEAPVYGDVVGELSDWTDGVLTITRKDGTVTRVAEHTLVAGKVVPAVPTRGPSALAPAVLQAALDRAWPAVEHEALGGWHLRAAAGFTRRANSVLPLDEPGVPLDEALAHTERWYTDRGLPTRLQVVVGSPLDLQLAERGWGTEASAIVRTARLAAVHDRLTGVTVPDGLTVTVTDELDADWMSVYHKTAPSGPAADAARHVLTGSRGTFFAEATTADTPVAIGRCTVDLSTGLRLANFTAIEVAPPHRRQGLARAVMAALTTRALSEGAVLAYLSVEPENTPARTLYDTLGFTDHHHYHYRTRA